MSAQVTPGRERRRFPRFEVQVPVVMRRKNGEERLVTCDVSRHGAFIRTERPAPLRQLVQLRFLLPGIGDVEAMCMVARWLDGRSPPGPGMGIDFFALSKEAKGRWERFLGELRARAIPVAADEPRGSSRVSAMPPSLGVPLPPEPSAPPGMPEWMAPTSVTGAVTMRPARGARDGNAPAAKHGKPETLEELERHGELPTPDAPLRPWSPPRSNAEGGAGPPPRLVVPPPPPPDDDEPMRIDVHGSVFILKLADRAALRAFVEQELERGGFFLRTHLVRELGDRIDVVLVHPETDEELHIEGTVVRRVIAGPLETRGLGVFLKALSSDSKRKLDAFVENGGEVVELEQVVSERQLELEAAVAREPDSAEALEALGTYLLDEEGDLGGALTALTRALVLGPGVISIHASLARAYRRIGDQVKVRAHERVAEALMLFQDKLKVRMGVGTG